MEHERNRRHRRTNDVPLEVEQGGVIRPHDQERRRLLSEEHVYVSNKASPRATCWHLHTEWDEDIASCLDTVVMQDLQIFPRSSDSTDSQFTAPDVVVDVAARSE